MSHPRSSTDVPAAPVAAPSSAASVAPSVAAAPVTASSSTASVAPSVAAAPVVAPADASPAVNKPTMEITFSQSSHSEVIRPGYYQGKSSSRQGTYSLTGALYYFQVLCEEVSAKPQDFTPLNIRFTLKYPNGNRAPKTQSHTFNTVKDLENAKRFLQALIRVADGYDLAGQMVAFVEYWDDIKPQNQPAPSPAPAAVANPVAASQTPAVTKPKGRPAVGVSFYNMDGEKIAYSEDDLKPLQIRVTQNFPNGHRDHRSFAFQDREVAKQFVEAVHEGIWKGTAALQTQLGRFAEYRNDLNQPKNNNSATTANSNAADPTLVSVAKKSGFAEFFKRMFSAIEAAFVKLVKLCLSSSKAKPAAPSTTATASASLSASAHSNPSLEAHAARVKADNEKINSAIKSHQATVKSQNNVLKSMFDAHAKKVKQGNEKVKEGMKGHQSRVSSQNAQIDLMVQNQQTRLTNR